MSDVKQVLVTLLLIVDEKEKTKEDLAYVISDGEWHEMEIVTVKEYPDN